MLFNTQRNFCLLSYGSRFSQNPVSSFFGRESKNSDLLSTSIGIFSSPGDCLHLFCRSLIFSYHCRTSSVFFRLYSCSPPCSGDFLYVQLYNEGGIYLGIKSMFNEKFSESLTSVLPITAIVLLLCFTVAPIPVSYTHLRVDRLPDDLHITQNQVAIADLF